MTIDRSLMLLGGVMYAGSWFVPVAKTSGELIGGDVWGWQAILFTLMNPALGDSVDASLLTRAWMIASSLSNALMIVTVVLMMCRVTVSSRRLGWSFVVASVINALWIAPPDARQELRIGYYLWLTAFVLWAVAFFLDARRKRGGVTIGGAAA